MSVEQEIADRLRSGAYLLTRPQRERRQEIKLMLMEYPSVNVDSEALVDRIEDLALRVTPRLRTLLDLSDREIADVVKKSRATIQAYAGGRLQELIEPEDALKFLHKAEERLAELHLLIRDLRTLANKTSSR